VLGGGAADIFVVTAEQDGKTALYVVDAKAAESRSAALIRWPMAASRRS
jgi:hypothetical protein